MTSKYYRLFLIGLSLLGMLAVTLATLRFGPGLSTDGARYLSTADNLLGGRGALDYLDLPLTSWPPLYALLLAAAGWLAGGDVFLGGQVLNILCFGLIVWLSGLVFERSLPGRGWAAAASLLVASSLPLIEVSANIASDPLFAVMMLVSLLLGQRYLEQRRRSDLLLLALLAIASTFLRYAGVLLIASGALLALLAWRPDWRKGLAHAVGFGLLASLPIAAWAVFHNLPQSGTLLGSHRPAEPWTNFLLLFEKLGGWFAPISWVQGTWVALGLLAVLGALLLLGRRHLPWLWADLQSPACLPVVLMFVIYSAVLVFTISTSEHRVPGSQRLHVLLLPMFLILFFTLLQRTLPGLPRGLLLGGLLLVLALPLYRVQAYVRAALREGDVSFYNLYNTGTIRQSDIAAYLQSQPFEAGTVVYSNNEAAAWFYLRQSIRRLPRYEVDLGEDADTAIRTFTGWPAADEEAVLVWFERDLDYKDQVPTPDETVRHLALTTLFSGRYGNVYRFAD